MKLGISRALRDTGEGRVVTGIMPRSRNKHLKKWLNVRSVTGAPENRQASRGLEGVPQLSYPGAIPAARRVPRNSVVRIVVETSLPAHTAPSVRALLAPGALPAGAVGHLEEHRNTGLGAGPARGDNGDWVPYWISLQFSDARDPGLAETLRGLHGAVVGAARQGGLELHLVPAAVQWGETYHRVRNLEETLRLPTGAG